VAISELDEAVTRLLESSDDSRCSGGHPAGNGGWSADEVPTTPPPHGGRGCDLLVGTPAKVSLLAAQDSSPEPPPGLQKNPHSGDLAASPVVLNLSSMAFPGGSVLVEEMSSLHHPLPLLPVDGWGLPPLAVDHPHGLANASGELRGANSDAPLLATPPGIAVAETETGEQREAGAFLLGLLKAGPGVSGPPGDQARRQTKDTQSPTTASTASPASATAGSAGDVAAEASPSPGGRRPTRRGRRAGHTRY